jgi:hypothetical protein
VKEQWAWIMRAVPPTLVIDLRAMFAAADTDSGGTLSRDEVAQTCQLLHKGLTDNRIDAVFRCEQPPTPFPSSSFLAPVSPERESNVASSPPLLSVS